MPASPFSRPQPAYDPVPDLEPESAFRQVLQWVVDHSEGPISQMSVKGLEELATAMFAASCRPSRKQREKFFEEHLPLIVKALVGARQKMFHRDLDSTSFFAVCAGDDCRGEWQSGAEG
jgi:hypothetical protein